MRLVWDVEEEHALTSAVGFLLLGCVLLAAYLCVAEVSQHHERAGRDAEGRRNKPAEGVARHLAATRRARELENERGGGYHGSSIGRAAGAPGDYRMKGL